MSASTCEKGGLIKLLWLRVIHAQRTTVWTQIPSGPFMCAVGWGVSDMTECPACRECTIRSMFNSNSPTLTCHITSNMEFTWNNVRSQGHEPQEDPRLHVGVILPQAVGVKQREQRGGTEACTALRGWRSRTQTHRHTGFIQIRICHMSHFWEMKSNCVKNDEPSVRMSACIVSNW